MYKINIKILGTEYKAKGKNIGELLDNIPLTWKEIKGRGEAVIERYSKKDNKNVLVKSIDKTFPAPVLRRIKMNKVARALWIKRLEPYLV